MNIMTTTTKWDEIILKQSAQSLAENIEVRWGDPQENIDMSLKTGTVLDTIAHGIHPELTTIIGQSGSRKSTLLANIALHNGSSRQVEDNKRIPLAILTNESGVSASRYFDMLIAMAATHYMKSWVKNGTIKPNEMEYVFVDYLYYYQRSEHTEKAIRNAITLLSRANIVILGAGEEGHTDIITEYENIFKALHDKYGYFAVFLDNVNAIYIPNSTGNDYENMNAIVPLLSRMVKIYHIPLLAVSQVSLASVRNKSLIARGGLKLKEESGLVCAVDYIRTPEHKIKIWIDKNRHGDDKITVEVPIEPQSGILLDRGSIITPGSGESGTSTLFNYESEEMEY